MGHTTKCLVIVPTYNEAGNIEQLIRLVQNQGEQYDLLIIDDNSPDGTGKIVDEIASTSNGRVQLMHRCGKLGLGTAYLAGFEYGLEQGYEYIFQMDADLSHHPKYLPQLLAAAQTNGVAIGSRLVKGGRVENWPWYRKIISRGGSLYSRLVLDLHVRDCTSGFKCFSRATLQILDLKTQIQSSGFGFQVEANYLCERNGYVVAEVPITFLDRVSGQSKMNSKIFGEALLLVWQLKFRRKAQASTTIILPTTHQESYEV